MGEGGGAVGRDDGFDVEPARRSAGRSDGLGKVGGSAASAGPTATKPSPPLTASSARKPVTERASSQWE